MFKQVYKILASVFTKFESSNQAGQLSTFTYFIPSAPVRNSGYREKQFDKTLHELLEKGMELVDIKAQSSSSHGPSGLWVICILRQRSENISKLHLDYPSLSESIPDTLLENNLCDQKFNDVEL